jgi:putative nucleotidyltransferase with HDIG domain
MRSATKTMLAVGAVGAAWAIDALRRDDRLRTTHRILIDLLLNALTADDPLTARHSRRVADLSFALGCECGLYGPELTTLRVAALLHDMGKIDDRFWEIVHSRDRLTPEQRAEMQQHPDESARILEPLETLHPRVGAIVSSHHERWDGEGYPDCLKGEEIPLAARIIAMADAFDAMTQPRKYRGSMPAEEALRRIHEGAGQQFDPRLVELLDAPCVREEWEQVARDGLAEEIGGGERREMVADSTER